MIVFSLTGATPSRQQCIKLGSKAILDAAIESRALNLARMTDNHYDHLPTTIKHRHDIDVDDGLFASESHFHYIFYIYPSIQCSSLILEDIALK